MAKKIPHFRSAQQEAAFWDTHSVADYVESLKKVDDLFLSPALAGQIRESAKKRLVSLRLSNWEIEKAKEVAKKQKVPYQTLMRQWIDDGLRRAHKAA